MKKSSFDDLKGKVCVITGGAGLIGKSLSESLASAGVRIAILDLEKDSTQNRFLLISQKTGNLNSRGKKIISSTPMGKFGSAKDLNGATLFLLSDLSSFITGVVLPIDGGFNAYSGV